MKLDAMQKGIQESLGGIVAQVVKDAQDKVDKELNEFKTKKQKEFEDLHKKVPVMVVEVDPKIGAKKLSTTVSPHLARLILHAKLGFQSMLVGPAGCGKTTMAHQLAESLGKQFASVCLTAGASETWLFGRQTPNGFVEGPFAKIYKEGGVFLADEMDAADANLLLSLNTALSHDEIINPMNGEVMKKHKDFHFIGAANTNGKGANHVYTGRTRLDAATLDRFSIIMVDYDSNLEAQLCPNNKLNGFLRQTRNVLKSEGLDEFVSTRAFKSAQMMHEAGLTYDEIKETITANWGGPAKKYAQHQFDEVFNKVEKTAANEGFYQTLLKNVRLDGITAGKKGKKK